MGYAELIERLQALPHDKQVEVFDFIEFLSQRSTLAARGPHADWTDAEFSGLAMKQALRDIEDEPPTYTAANFRERWQ
jgi:hypothetical protein